MEKEINQASINTDKELFKETAKDWKDEGYQPIIFVTKNESIGMNVGGSVFIMPITLWHKLAQEDMSKQPPVSKDSLEKYNNG